MTFDIVIENGLVVDGTGAPGRVADVGIVKARIGAIGDLKSAPTARRLAATRCVVAPGFIDIHNHSDLVTAGSPRPRSTTQSATTSKRP